MQLGTVYSADDIARPGAEPVPGYCLRHRLGRGTLGEVWKAEAAGGFPVALKFMRLAAGRENHNEMRALQIARAIRHPNLLVSFGAWKVDGYVVLGMELADRTLWDRYRESRAAGLPGIPRDELLGYLTDAARALDHLNDNTHKVDGRTIDGVPHRRVKPQNILLFGDAVKVADFGLARLRTQSVACQSGPRTFAYAAPEFFRKQVGRQSDQYCLAVTYCHMRGGRLPFVGSAGEVLAGHLLSPPDLSMLPQRERPAVARALAKEPNDRWPSCGAFLAALWASAQASQASVSSEGPESAVPVASGARSEPVSALAIAAAFEAPVALEVPEPPNAAPSTRRPWKPRAASTTLLFLVAMGLAIWVSQVPGHGRHQPPQVSSAGLQWASLPPQLSQSGTALAGTRRPSAGRVAGRLGLSLETNEFSQRKPVPGIGSSPSPEPSPAGKTATATGTGEPGPRASAVRLALPTLPESLFAPDSAPADLSMLALAKPLPSMAPANALPPAPATVSAREPSRTQPRLDLNVAEHLALEPGKSASLEVSVRREGFHGPVAIHFEEAPEGVSFERAMVGRGSSLAQLKVVASAEAEPCVRVIRVVGIAGGFEAASTFQLEIKPDPALVHARRGHDLFDEGNFTHAISEFSQALQLKPDDPSVCSSRAMAHHKLGQLERAIADYSRSLRLDPANAVCANNRGLAYRELGRYDKAIADYTEAIRLKPGDATVYFNRGMAYFFVGDHVSAIVDFTEAIRLRPQFAEAYERRADAHARRGEAVEALADHNTAIRLAGQRSAAQRGGPVPLGPG